MKRSYQVTLFILIAVFYCVVGAFAQPGKQQTGLFKTTMPLSAGTRMFIADLEKELKASGKGIKYFQPSAELVDRHSLQNVKGQYFVTGFIKVNAKFKPEQIKKIGGYSGKPSGKVRTVRIPLQAFPRFLELKTITYFELGQKQQLYRSHTN
jgi:hypothetical protein